MPNKVVCMPLTGEQISLHDLMAGLKFSWPIYKSGFKVMISQAQTPIGTWGFASAFHWTVWVAVGGTAVYMGFIIALVEIITCKKSANKKGRLRCQKLPCLNYTVLAGRCSGTLFVVMLFSLT
jgi:hypothetical protein